MGREQRCSWPTMNISRTNWHSFIISLQLSWKFKVAGGFGQFDWSFGVVLETFTEMTSLQTNKSRDLNCMTSTLHRVVKHWPKDYSGKFDCYGRKHSEDIHVNGRQLQTRPKERNKNFCDGTPPGFNGFMPNLECGDLRRERSWGTRSGDTTSWMTRELDAALNVLRKRATRKEEFLRAFRTPTHPTRTKSVFTDLADDLRFWAEHMSWAYCRRCGSLQSKKLLPGYRKRAKQLGAGSGSDRLHLCKLWALSVWAPISSLTAAASNLFQISFSCGHAPTLHLRPMVKCTHSLHPGSNWPQLQRLREIPTLVRLPRNWEDSSGEAPHPHLNRRGILCCCVRSPGSSCH